MNAEQKSVEIRAFIQRKCVASHANYLIKRIQMEISREKPLGASFPSISRVHFKRVFLNLEIFCDRKVEFRFKDKNISC